MKKLILIGLLGVMVTSCKKEYTCDCTFYWSNGNVGNTTSQKIKASKEDAENKCAQNEGNYVPGANYKVCHLK